MKFRIYQIFIICSFVGNIQAQSIWSKDSVSFDPMSFKSFKYSSLNSGLGNKYMQYVGLKAFKMEPTLDISKVKMQRKKITIKLPPLYLFQETFGIKPISDKDRPKVAFMRALTPVMGWVGWGQYTNNQYWKMPIVAGAAGLGIYAIKRTGQNFQKYKNVLTNWKDQSVSETVFGYGPFTFETVNTYTKQLRKYNQLSYIVFGAGWLLVAIEANVAAHLKSFDVSSDISFKIQPTILPTMNGVASGIKMDLNFK